MVYEGNEKYIFVSYSHNDSEVVTKAINALQENGYRVWYDKGIEAGTEWPEYIAEHLEACECFIAFLSRSAIDSTNCRQEINLACNLNKKLLVIYLEDVELTPGMRLRLSSTQAMFKFRCSSTEEFYQQLTSAKIFADCRIPAPEIPADEATAPKTEPTPKAEPAPKAADSSTAHGISDEPPAKQEGASKKDSDEDDEVELTGKAKIINNVIILLHFITIPFSAYLINRITSGDYEFWMSVLIFNIPSIIANLTSTTIMACSRKSLTASEIDEIEGAMYGMPAVAAIITTSIGFFVASSVGFLMRILIPLGLGVSAIAVVIINVIINSVISPDPTEK